MQRLLTKGIGHTKFQSSPLGEIPKSWEVVKIGALIENHDKHRIPIKAELRQKMKGIYPYYGAQGIIDYVNDYIFDGKYMLVAEDGENLKSRTNDIAFIVGGKFLVNNHAHILTCNKRSNMEFMKYYLNFTSIYKYLTGMAQPKLNREKLESIQIALPDRHEQQKIASILSTVDEKLETLQSKKAQYEQLKKGLMQQLLTGKIRVKVNENNK